MGRRNEAKAKALYDVIDAGYYRGHAAKEARSRMNVTFRLPDEAAEKRFLGEAAAAGMVGLSGHRSVGGVRASIYNAVSPESCAALAELMRDFAKRNG
jgi:phosphoserine aminotransferase